MKTFLILFAAVAVASAATTHKKRATYQASLNDYVDKVISKLQAHIVENSLDSIPLPNVTQTFSTTPLWITYSGRLSLYDGVLENLSSVRRYGDVTITYGDKTFGITANLGIDKLTFNYAYGCKLLGITASGTADGSVASIDIGTGLNANLGEYTLGLDYFAVNSVGTVSAKLHGNSAVDWLATAILNLVIANIKDSVANEISSVATSAIESGLENVNAIIADLITTS